MTFRVQRSHYEGGGGERTHVVAFSDVARELIIYFYYTRAVQRRRFVFLKVSRGLFIQRLLIDDLESFDLNVAGKAFFFLSLSFLFSIEKPKTKIYRPIITINF